MYKDPKHRDWSINKIVAQYLRLYCRSDTGGEGCEISCRPFTAGGILNFVDWCRSVWQREHASFATDERV